MVCRVAAIALGPGALPCPTQRPDATPRCRLHALCDAYPHVTAAQTDCSDCTVGLGMMSLDPPAWRERSIADMTPEELSTARQWLATYRRKYAVVGTLVADDGKPFYDGDVEGAAGGSSRL